MKRIERTTPRTAPARIPAGSGNGTGDTRGLTQPQVAALELVAAGRPDTEAADAAGVTRQTVNTWRHHDAQFIAAVNERRREVWEDHRHQLRSLYGEAIKILGDSMKYTMPIKALPAVAIILRAVGDLPAPDAPTTAEGVIRAQAEALVTAEDRAKPTTALDQILDATGEGRAERVRAAMEKIRAGGS